MVLSKSFSRRIRRCVSLFVLSAFLLQTACPADVSAQSAPSPVSQLYSLTSDFRLMPSGLSLDPRNPLEFELLIDGDAVAESADQSEYLKLIKYFLASLTIPEKEMWVNLSPAEPERVVPPVFAQTAMGCDMLAQDFVLKQLTASLMNPQGEAGRKFWDKVYEKIYNIGAIHESPVQNTAHHARRTTDLIESFNKVWIVPDKAVVYQNGARAYVIESRLKVMLESDYLLGQNSPRLPLWERGGRGELEVDIKDLIRETIIPLIEDEVNNGESFANLRQMYRAMILAYWFKQALKSSLLGQVYADRNKVSGIREEIGGSGDQVSGGHAPRATHHAPAIDDIYNQYLTKFRDGAFDLIKEDYDPVTQSTVARKYFSGGIINEIPLAFSAVPTLQSQKLPNRAQLALRFSIEPLQSKNADGNSAMLISHEGLTALKEYNGFSEIKTEVGKLLLRNPGKPYWLESMNKNLPDWKTLIFYRKAFSRVLEAAVKRTPFIRLVDDPFNIFIKDEGQQETNSFKVRILAQFLVLLLSKQAREKIRGKTITTGTTGNQGQAVAWMVMVLNQKYNLGLKAVIYAAKDTPQKKIHRMRDIYGAEVHVVKGQYERARDAAIKLEMEDRNNVIYMTHSGRSSVDSYASSMGLELVADMIDQAKAQGTLRKNFGFETYLGLKRKLSMYSLSFAEEEKLFVMQKELDSALSDWIVFVPVGAGGIAAATLAAVKMITPHIKFIGVCTENTNSIYHSIKEGRVVKIKQKAGLIEDGIGVDEIEELALHLFLEAADGVVVIPSEKLPEGIRVHWNKFGIMSEGASVLPYLASQMKEVRTFMRNNGIKNVAGVSTGSNIVEKKWKEITGEQEIPEVNRAMVARQAPKLSMPNVEATAVPARKGGIDFDPASMNFEAQGNAAMLEVSPNLLNRLENAAGFVPSIIGVHTVAAPAVWLGLNDGGEEGQDGEQPRQAADEVWKNVLSLFIDLRSDDAIDV